MFRKRASRPKKNYISRTHGHRAHPRTKGKARRGGVGRWEGLAFRLRAKGTGGARGVVRLARALMVLPTLRLAPTLYHHLCPLDPLCPSALAGAPLERNKPRLLKGAVWTKKRQMTRKSSVNFQTQRRGRDWLLRSLHSLRLTPFPSARRRGPCKPYTQQEATS